MFGKLFYNSKREAGLMEVVGKGGACPDFRVNKLRRRFFVLINVAYNVAVAVQ